MTKQTIKHLSAQIAAASAEISRAEVLVSQCEQAAACLEELAGIWRDVRNELRRRLAIVENGEPREAIP